MTAPGTGTCAPWAEVGDVCAPCNAYDFDLDLLAEGIQIASDVLYEFTKRRWPGTCTDLVRPCGYRQADSCGCRSSRSCGCTRLSELELPGHPVASVEAVKIDGVLLDPDRYRVDDHRWLVYLPESDDAERQGWPCCQRIDLPDTAEDTWSVAYSYGQDPPLGGRRAAANLGCQLALSCTPALAGQCKLPKRVTSITRQGLTVAVIDPLSLFKDGLVGLADVDLWVQSVNFGAKHRQAQVFVPGHGPGVRRTDT